MANTVWWKLPASTSSSRTGSLSKSAAYHGVLRLRSVTVTATWVKPGNSGIGGFSFGWVVLGLVRRITVRSLTEVDDDADQRLGRVGHVDEVGAAPGEDVEPVGGQAAGDHRAWLEAAHVH